jgi:endoglucanase
LTLLTGKIPEGGLIDGPAYSRIYNSLRGLSLLRPDSYAPFQGGKVVYHDDIGDYSTNEPTMDGTASLSFYLSTLEKEGLKQAAEKESASVTDQNGAIVRKDITRKEIYLVFSADEYGDGMEYILNVLAQNNAEGSFFLTGNFLRNPIFSKTVNRIISEKHYIGPHSDKHLLYNDWEERDSLLVTRADFTADLKANYKELEKKKADLSGTKYFLAPYEWYNSAIAEWTAGLGAKLINFTPGSGTSADYTTPDMTNYRSSVLLFDRLKSFEASDPHGLNGAIILIHPGTHPDRTDKFYKKLDEIIKYFSSKGYSFNKLQ